ncbi:NUCB2 family protein [Megaselia abdita]
MSNNIDTDHLKVAQMVHHLDHTNEHTFEIDDLHKLIKKTSSDLAEADKKRREEFKQYEMQKEFEKNTIEKEMDDESKKRYEDELKDKKEKHNKHDKLHHPGNKAQLEEVWEKQDHMDPEDFDPKTFFMMHDIDSNGHWDESEVKALFVKELDKVYQSGIPEDDMRERAEEMERMREHVFTETDTNRDGLISFQEFLDQTKREEFQKDPEWETVDNQPQFTHEEYLEFERKRQEEIQKLIAQGAMPPHPQMPYGYHPNGQPNIPPGHLPPPHYQQNGQQFQQHPGVPVHLNQNQVYEHVPQGQQGQHYQGQPQQYQGQQYQQVPQHNQQYVPQQGQQYQQAPQYQQQQPQYQQGQQIPQQGHVPQGQVNQQGQAPQGQIPQQGQVPQGQVPQQGQVNQQVPQQGQVPQGQVPQQGQVNQQVNQQQQNPSKEGHHGSINSIH